jgi:hypothetical protein
MKSMKFSRVFVALTLSSFLFIGAECNVDGPTDPPLKPNELTASVSEEGFFDGTLNRVTKDGSSKYILKAVERSTLTGGVVVERDIDIEIPIRTEIPYTVNLSTDPIGLVAYCNEDPPGTCIVYSARKSVASSSGSITVTEATSSTLKGTFNATMVKVGGGDTRTITNGSFYGVF